VACTPSPDGIALAGTATKSRAPDQPSPNHPHLTLQPHKTTNVDWICQSPLVRGPTAPSMDWLWAMTSRLFGATRRAKQARVLSLHEARVPHVVKIGRRGGPGACPCSPAPATVTAIADEIAIGRRRPAPERLLLLPPYLTIPSRTGPRRPCRASRLSDRAAFRLQPRQRHPPGPIRCARLPIAARNLVGYKDASANRMMTRVYTKARRFG